MKPIRDARLELRMTQDERDALDHATSASSTCATGTGTWLRTLGLAAAEAIATGEPVRLGSLVIRRTK